VASFREHELYFELRRRLARQRRLRRQDRLLPYRLLGTLLFAGAVALVVMWPNLAVLRDLREAHGKAPSPVAHEDPRQLSGPSARLVYAYSVVPGGVTDAAEAQRAVAADPVVGEHYRGLDLARLTITTLKSEKMAYVSFRKGGQVYWTTKRVLLPKGETVLSDGANLVRARCGNRISDASMSKTAPQEPPLAELDTPLPPGGPMAPLPTPGPDEQNRLLALALPAQLPELLPPLPETPEEMITSAPEDGTLIPAEGPAGPYWYAMPLLSYFPSAGVGPVLPPVITPTAPSGGKSAGSTPGTSSTGTPSEQSEENHVPEPSSWLLVGGGVVGCGLLARSRRRGRRWPQPESTGARRTV
jgi:hypothetical protein